MAKHRQRAARAPLAVPGRASAVFRGVALAALLAAGLTSGIKLYGIFSADPMLAAGPASRVAASSIALEQGSAGHRRTAGTATRSGKDGHSGPIGSKPTPSVTVSGSSVTVIGDSITVGSAPELEQVLPGVTVNAVVGRQFSTGVQIAAQLKAEGQLRPIVVFALGTNGPVSSADMSALMTEVGPHRKVVLVTTFEPRSWQSQVNTTLESAAQTYPNIVLADWYAAIKSHTNLLWADQIHPQTSGSKLWAQVIKAAVERAANLG